ncbi:MAG: hypothetical protein AAF485_19620 [Chloroflexota bacterium]
MSQSQRSPVTAPLIRALQRLRAAFWRRRFLVWLVRASWLALLVPTVVLDGYLWAGWQIDWPIWMSGMVLVAGLSLLWSLRPISLRRLVHRLDKRLGYRSQLITALEVTNTHQTTDEPNLVTQRLLQEGVETVIDLRHRVPVFNRALWLEAQALVAVSALLTGLLIVDSLTVNIPQNEPAALPPVWQEPRADEIVPPNPQLFPPALQSQTQVQTSLSEAQIQAALEALADALRDQASTRAIADALDQGDLEGAAESLRRLADQLDDLSPQSQADLGEALEEAAEAIGENAPLLTEPLQQGSDSLEGEAPGDAREALEALADALDQLAEAPTEIAENPPTEPQPSDSGEETAPESAEDSETETDSADEDGEGEGAGEEEGTNPSADTERLALEGEPLELENDDSLDDTTIQSAELDAEAGDDLTEDSPFSRQSNSAASDDLGPDSLTYPWEQREVVRSYFTP